MSGEDIFTSFDEQNGSNVVDFQETGFIESTQDNDDDFFSSTGQSQLESTPSTEVDTSFFNEQPSSTVSVSSPTVNRLDFSKSDFDEDLPPYIEWKAEHQKRLEKKMEEEKKQEEELRKNAAKELEEFHAQRKERIEKSKKENRAAQGGSGSDDSKGNDWDKVASLINLNNPPKTKKDTSRMREVLLSLKSEN